MRYANEHEDKSEKTKAETDVEASTGQRLSSLNRETEKSEPVADEKNRTGDEHEPVVASNPIDHGFSRSPGDQPPKIVTLEKLDRHRCRLAG